MSDAFTSGDPQSVALFPTYGIADSAIPGKGNLSLPAQHTYSTAFRVAKMLGADDKTAKKEAFKQVKMHYKLKGGIWC